VKRSTLLRHLRRHGCYLKREGASHSLWVNPATGVVDSVPATKRSPRVLLGRSVGNCPFRKSVGSKTSRPAAADAANCAARLSGGVMQREMRRWVRIPAALAAAATAIAALLIMAGAFAVTYNPVQADGSIDNVPARALGLFLLGAPSAVALASVAYLGAFTVHPPTRVFSWLHCARALGLAVAVSVLLAISARDSFARWYEALYLVAVIPVLFAPLEAGFLMGSTVVLGINRSSRRGPVARAADR
jgi:mRNA interferase HicA